MNSAQQPSAEKFATKNKKLITLILFSDLLIFIYFPSLSHGLYFYVLLFSAPSNKIRRVLSRILEAYTHIPQTSLPFSISAVIVVSFCLHEKLLT
jgi:hypothetical protein